MSATLFIGPALAGLVAVSLYVAKAWAERRDRHRQFYAEAYQWYAAYKEFPFAIRRRTSESDERVRLSEALREVQGKLEFFTVWTALEAPAVGVAYAELLQQLRQIAGKSMHDAWLEPPITTDAEMNFPPGRVDLSGLLPYEKNYLNAVERQLHLRRRFLS